MIIREDQAYDGIAFLNKITFLKRLDSLVGPFLARVIPASSSIEKTPFVVERVLFIRPGGIGDAVLLIPAIQALSIRYPQATVEVLAEKRNAAVFEMCPAVERVFRYDNWRDWHKLLLRQYDVVVDTEQWHYLSALIARLLRAPIRCGFATNERHKLFTHSVVYHHDCYEVESFFSLLTVLAVKKTDLTDCRYLTISSTVESRCGMMLKPLANRSYVVFFPGASIDERRWGAGSFAALAQRFFQQGLAVVVVGGKDDVAAGEQIISTLSQGHGLNLAGKTTLSDTAALLNGAKLLVSGDSGVLHLGAGVGCSSVSLFGPGIEKKWAPQGDNHRVVNLNLSCSPCTRFGTTPVCTDRGRCIKDISVDRVWTAVTALRGEGAVK